MLQDALSHPASLTQPESKQVSAEDERRIKGIQPPSCPSVSLGWQQISQQSSAKSSQFAILRTWTLQRLLFSALCPPPNKFLAQLETQMLSSLHPASFLSAELKDQAFIWSVACLFWPQLSGKSAKNTGNGHGKTSVEWVFVPLPEDVSTTWM